MNAVWRWSSGWLFSKVLRSYNILQSRSRSELGISSTHQHVVLCLGRIQKDWSLEHQSRRLARFDRGRPIPYRVVSSRLPLNAGPCPAPSQSRPRSVRAVCASRACCSPRLAWTLVAPLALTPITSTRALHSCLHCPRFGLNSALAPSFRSFVGQSLNTCDLAASIRNRNKLHRAIRGVPMRRTPSTPHSKHTVPAA